MPHPVLPLPRRAVEHPRCTNDHLLALVRLLAGPEAALPLQPDAVAFHGLLEDLRAFGLITRADGQWHILYDAPGGV
jgi:hypothetical protein